MAEIRMPKLSENMTDGMLLKWCVEPGQRVQAGDVVAEVETDKANMEIEATQAGVVAALCAVQGDIVPVGSTLIVLDGTESDHKPSEGTAQRRSTAPTVQPEITGAPLPADTSAPEAPANALQTDCDLLVIGGGQAGSYAAMRASALGARVCLVDGNPLGVGGTFIHQLETPIQVLAEFARLHERSAKGRDELWLELRRRVNSACQVQNRLLEQDLEAAGVRLVSGRAFVTASEKAVVLDNNGNALQSIHARAILIASGCTPTVPQVLAAVAGFIREPGDLLRSRQRPESCIVWGDSPDAFTLAGALAGIGVKTVLAVSADATLPDESIRRVEEADGPIVRLDDVKKVSEADDQVHVDCTSQGKEKRLSGQAVVWCGELKPLTTGLGLMKLGIAPDPASGGGIPVDTRMTTPVRSVFAAGGCVRGGESVNTTREEGQRAAECAFALISGRLRG